MREIFLKIGVAGADENRVGTGRFQLARDVNLPGDADKRIFRRLISIAGRIDRRALKMRVVVGRAATDVDQLHVELAEHVDEGDGLGEVRLERILLIDAEGEAVGEMFLKFVRDARSRQAANRAVGFVGWMIEGGQAHPDFQFRRGGADSGNDLAGEAGAIFE